LVSRTSTANGGLPALPLDQCDYAIGGQRDIREHFRIV
jgi:hypothetical protein